MTAETTRKKKTYSAPALEKGLDILELLSTQVDGLRIADIVEQLNKSYGELFRMLVVLEQRGYVELPEGTDRYCLTMKMFGLANRFPPVNRLTSIAGPILKKLAFTIGQSCHLVTFYDGIGHVIAQHDSSSARNFSVRLGADVPLANTCSGHILLAFASPERFEMMINSIPDHDTQVTEEGFKETAEKVRNNGYEVIKSTQVHASRDFGFPVFDHTGDILAALSVPFMDYVDESHMPIKEAMELTRVAAEELSAKLGYTG